MTDDMTLVTFRRSQSAMAATAFSGKEVGGASPTSLQLMSII